MIDLLTPEETRPLTIFTMLGKRKAAAWRWIAAIALAAVAWIGGLAFLAQYRPTEVWRLFAGLGSSQQVYAASLGLALAACVAALILRQRGLAALAGAVAAYLGAFWLGGLLYFVVDPEFDIPFAGMPDALGFSLSRLWWIMSAFVALGAAALVFRGQPGPHLGFGDWTLEARDVSAKERTLPYWRKLIVGFVIVALVLGVIFQASVGFEPIRSGRAWALMPAILLAAIVNASAEEVVYRGFLQPAFMRVVGAAGGMWTAGLLFGMAHWGMSVGVLAALPTSLLIGLGAVIWGKAAYETQGLAWPIAAHFLIDVAVMSAYFA